MPDSGATLAAALSDRYALARGFGRGAMATVYLAEDKKHGRKVAIKLLHPELAVLLGPERFLREIQIAARLAHPHILPLIDSGETRGLLYYVTPHVPQGSLRDRLRDYVSPVALATLYLGLGEYGQALEWTERAYEERRGWLAYLKVNPLLDPLRGQPRFEALVKKMRL